MQEGVIAKEWLSRFQGVGAESRMPIVEIEDLKASGGDTVVMTVESALVGDGVRGETELIGKEEKTKRRTYSLVVDFVRHATASTQRMRDFSAAKRKLGFTEMLSLWMALMKQHDGLLALVKAGAYTASGRANNLLWGGGGADDSELLATSVLDTSVMQAFRRKAVNLGARPANVTMEKGGEIPFFLLWATSNALAGLRNDTFWRSAAQLAYGREGGADARNPIFTGAFDGRQYEGMIAHEVLAPDHDNPESGAIGTPLEPRALLRAALNPSTAAAQDLLLGGSAATLAYNADGCPLYARDFPGYDYKFVSEQDAVVDANVYYAKIINPPGSTDAGKYEVVSYVGSTGNLGTKLVVDRGLNAGTADYSGTHPANALIVPCNENGVAYSNVICVGSQALIRAYGNSREELDVEGQDYQFKKGAAIKTVFGQAPAQRRDGKYPNFLIARVATDL
jgi:hypothetical protein